MWALIGLKGILKQKSREIFAPSAALHDWTELCIVFPFCDNLDLGPLTDPSDRGFPAFSWHLEP